MSPRRCWFSIGLFAASLLGERQASAETPIDEVVINATKWRPPAASSARVSAREFAAAPRRTAEDALQLVPGFLLVQHGSEGKGHQFFLRGFDAVHGADFALSVEGIVVNEWSNVHAQGYIDLGFVIPEAIESVEVTKGPFSIDQGAFAMAGSAEYELGIPYSDRGLRATYAAGTTNRHRGVVTYSPVEGEGHEFVALEAVHDDGFGQNRAIDRAVALGRVQLFDHGARGRLSVLGAAHVARFELPGALRNEDVSSGRVGFYDSYDRTSEGDAARFLSALEYECGDEELGLRALAFGGYRRLELLENFTGFLIDPVAGDRREQTQHTWSFGGDVSLGATLRDSLALHTGIGFVGDVFDQGQDHVDERRTALAAERKLEGTQALVHARAGLSYFPLEWLYVSAGARFDVALIDVEDPLAGGSERQGTLSSLSPRVSIQAEPWQRQTLFFSYGRGFRPPEARAFSSFEPALTGISDDVYTGGAPRMTATDSFELGSRWSAEGGVASAALAGFATFIERESIYDHVSGINLELNATRRLGGELVLSARPLANLSLGADATLVDARFVESGRPVPFAPRFIAGLRAMLGSELGVQGGLRLLGIASRDLPHSARGATLISLDATLGYRWQHWRLEAEIENVLGAELREGEYHYASEWQAGETASQLPVLHYVAGPPLNARVGLTAVF
jgi:iron complex outermembrane recepter protein